MGGFGCSRTGRCSCTILLPLWATITLFTIVNVVSYVDRGLIPGAFSALKDVIISGTGSTDTDKWIGVLQSSFVVGYSVGSLVMGHLVHIFPPFKLMAVGLAIWVLAVAICGFADLLGGFYTLLVARMLSGVGEASFQCVVPPWLDDNAPPAKRGMVLAIFYTAIPAGTAMGYAIGGWVGEHWGWQWMFRLEALPMIPCIALVYFLPFNATRRKVTEEVRDALTHDAASASASAATNTNIAALADAPALAVVPGSATKAGDGSIVSVNVSRDAASASAAALQSTGGSGRGSFSASAGNSSGVGSARGSFSGGSSSAPATPSKGPSSASGAGSAGGDRDRERDKERERRVNRALNRRGLGPAEPDLLVGLCEDGAGDDDHDDEGAGDIANAGAGAAAAPGVGISSGGLALSSSITGSSSAAKPPRGRPSASSVSSTGTGSGGRGSVGAASSPSLSNPASVRPASRSGGFEAVSTGGADDAGSYSNSNSSSGSGSGSGAAAHPHLVLHERAHYPHHVPPTAAEVAREAEEELAAIASATGNAAPARDVVEGAKPTFCQELKATLSNPIYMCITLGYAAFTAVTAGVGTFAPTFIVGLGLISDSSTASLAAGAVVSVAGIIGVPLGGYLIDRYQKRAKAAMRAERARLAAAAAAAAAATVSASNAYSPPSPMLSKRASGPSASPSSGSPSTPTAGGGAFPLSSARVDRASAAAATPNRSSISAPQQLPSALSPRPYAPPTPEVDPSSGLLPRGMGSPTSLVANAPSAIVVTTASAADDASAAAATAAALQADADDADAAEEEEEGTSPEILDIKLHVTLAQAVLLSAFGSCVMVAGVFLTGSLYPFLCILALGSVVLMATTAGVNLAMMASVPQELRPFAVGIGTLLLHALGDVPAQPVIGLIADDLAPCQNPPECTQRDAAGLRNTLLATTGWLFWPIAFWAAAWVVTNRRARKRVASGFYTQWMAGARARRATAAVARARAASEVLAGKLPGQQGQSMGGGKDIGDAYRQLASGGAGTAMSTPIASATTPAVDRGNAAGAFAAVSLADVEGVELSVVPPSPRNGSV